MKIPKQHSGLFSLQESFEGFVQQASIERPDAFRGYLREAIRTLTNERGERQALWLHRIDEAMTTVDLPLIFADILDRKLLAEYNGTPPNMRQVFRTARLNDFRTVKRNKTYGGDDLLQVVPEQAPYTAVSLSETEYEYAPQKWGKIFPFSWESFVNDNYDVIVEQPRRFARAATDTEEWFLTQMLFDENGPIDSYFTGTGGMSAVSSLPFSPENLKYAYRQMLIRQRENGYPLAISPTYLWHSPHMVLDVQEVLNSDLRITGEDRTLPNINIASRLNLRPLTVHWIPQVVSTATAKAETMWGLFTSQAELPIGEFGMLAALNGPRVFIRRSNQEVLAGGATGDFLGSFENDSSAYKVQHVFGGTTLDPRGSWASDGQ